MSDQTMLLRLDRIRIDGGTQSRAELSSDAVASYAEAIREARKAGRDPGFPPVVVFWDGSHYWLASGFHRWHAHQQANGARSSVMAVVRRGSVREARLYSISANIKNPERWTDKDKRHAVEMMLGDPEWVGWRNTEIARRCGSSEALVRAIRQEIKDRADALALCDCETDGEGEAETDPDAASDRARARLQCERSLRKAARQAEAAGETAALEHIGAALAALGPSG